MTSNERNSFKINYGWQSNNYKLYLLTIRRVFKSNNYELYLLTIRQILPIFSMNHTNYIRGVTLYLQDIMTLYLIWREEACRHRTAGIFNAVGCDLALEQFQNRYSAATEGFICVIKNEEAMRRWLLLYPFKNIIHSKLSSYLGIQSDTADDKNSQNEWTQLKIITEEKDVEIIELYDVCL